MGRALRAVSVDNLHITLKFLGETESDKVDAIGDTIRKCVAREPKFQYRLEGLGVFPHMRRPVVVWAGLENATPMVRIAQSLDEELEVLGFNREKRQFHPHLTLARINSRPPDALTELVEKNIAAQYGEHEGSCVHLIQSELLPQGAQYTTLQSIELLG
jgi:2'-5' RNA ligase